MWRLLFIAAMLALPAFPATRVLVTVVEQKTGKPVADLKAADFQVKDGGAARRVEAAEFNTAPADFMLLLDTSLVGGVVEPFAQNLIGQLRPNEQMAVVSFHSSADLIQDFTGSRDLLQRAIGSVKYGNTPLVLDALYAALDGGFEHSSLRRALILLTAGMEGNSRSSEADVVRLARRNGVSIYPVYVAGYERSMFEKLARQTGGASFNLQEMRKALKENPGARIFEAVRSHYTLTLAGNLRLSERLEVEVPGKGKLMVSALPLE
jgi:VWFA-related protein